MSTDSTPATRHRDAAQRFTQLAVEVTDWDVPTPVQEWTARDVVQHLVQWFPAMLMQGSGIALVEGPEVADDPAGAFMRQTEQVQALLDAPDTAARTYSSPMMGEMPLADMIDRFYTFDVWFHAWDLAKATGQDPRLDEEVCAQTLAGMREVEPMLRGSGQFGQQQPVADDAPASEQLAAFLGRDPNWAPPQG